MLENDIVIEKREAGTFKPLPQNIYQVELFDVNGEKKPTYDTRNKEDNEKVYETVFNFQFVLLAGKDGVDDLRGRSVWDNFVQAFLYIGSKNGKNKTYRIIEALLGRELTQQEEAEGITGSFINSLIGKQCRIMVENKTKDDKTWNVITKYVAKEVDYPSLTSDEKEKCKVKEKGEQQQDNTPLPEEIPVNEIQF